MEKGIMSLTAWDLRMSWRESDYQGAPLLIDSGCIFMQDARNFMQ
jgi:hypothetical protein